MGVGVTVLIGFSKVCGVGEGVSIATGDDVGGAVGWD